MDDLFGGPLRPDPKLALAPPSMPPNRPAGPMHKVQFVVEFVGPKSLPSAEARTLLDPRWKGALGEPFGWEMAPFDSEWRPLGSSTSNSLDSLALAWDLVSTHGSLSSASAAKLLATAQGLEQTLQRRALPLPTPQDVDATVATLTDVRDSLDIGFSVIVVPNAGEVDQAQIWRDCAAYGLSLESDGAFAWVVGDNRLLEVTSLDDGIQFSLGAVQAGKANTGVCISLRVARCAAPLAAFDAAERLALGFAAAWRGGVFDDEGSLVQSSFFQHMRANLAEALKRFAEVGIEPGSAEAERLFG